MERPLFELDQVRFRSVLSIDHLAIRSDRLTCIVGASGSGKSTLLRLLNRLISPTEGVVRYRGEDSAALDAVQLRRSVVMLPQNPIMFDGDLRENVNMGRQFSEKPPADDVEVERLLSLLKINKPLTTNTAYLSGGERQRVALCRVLAMQPEVLLLDEPSSALDDGTEEIVMQQVVAETRARGANLVLVTHSRAVASAWGEDVIDIEAGRVARVTAHE